MASNTGATGPPGTPKNVSAPAATSDAMTWRAASSGECSARGAISRMYELRGLDSLVSPGTADRAWLVTRYSFGQAPPPAQGLFADDVARRTTFF